MSTALARKFRITFSQSEVLKRDPTKAKRMSVVDSELVLVHQRLVEEIRRSLENFTSVQGRRQVEAILACGGAFRTPGLWRYLRHSK